MINDQFNNQVNTSNIEILEALNSFETNFLNYNKNSNKIFELSEKYSEFLIFQLHSTLISIFMDNLEGFKKAKKYISKSKNLIEKGVSTERDINYYNFLSKLLNKKIFKALNYLDKLIYQNTNDLFFAKIGQIFYFSIGDNCKMLDIANLIVNNNKKNPYALSMLSFALEESNQIHKAKEVALKAIEIYPSDPWAHHTLAHIFEVENKPEAGITTLEDFSYHWKNCNSFIYTHNWWHIALFYLRINKIDKVFQIFNNHLWNSPNADNTYSQDQAGAISLLIRLKLKNENIKKEWEKVSREIIKRNLFLSDPFIATHYAFVIGTIGDNDLKKKFLDELDSLSYSKNEYDKKIWKKSGVYLCKAMINFAENNFQNAYIYFNKSKKYWHLVGGSHTQRDLFNILFYETKKIIQI